MERAQKIEKHFFEKIFSGANFFFHDPLSMTRPSICRFINGHSLKAFISKCNKKVLRLIDLIRSSLHRQIFNKILILLLRENTLRDLSVVYEIGES